MPPEPLYQKGDWLMFMRAGIPIIGIVLHVSAYKKAYSGRYRYTTTSGDVTETSVLEARKLKEDK